MLRTNLRQPMMKLLLIAYLATAGCATHNQLARPQLPRTAALPHAEINERAEELMIRGSIAELINDYPSALLAYQEALVYEPNSPGIHLAIAQIYQKMSKFESALKVLRQAAEIDSTNIDVLENLAILLEFMQDFPGAIKYYEKLIRLSQINVEYRMRAASLYLQLREDERAIEQYEEIVKLGYATPKTWRPLGLIYLGQKRFDEARTVFTDWLEEYPDDEQAYLDIGEIYKAKQDTVGLVNWLRQTLQDNPAFDVVRGELQDVYLATGKLDAAIALYAKAVAEDSTNLANLGQLGSLYLQAGDTLHARLVFERFLSARPEDWRSYYYLGRLNYVNSRWRDTVRFLEKATSFNDKEPVLWLLLGETYLRIDSLRSAETALTRAQALAPKNKDTNYLLGFALYRLNKTEEAVPYFEVALELDSTDVRPMGILASYYSEQGNYTRSDSLYEVALRIAPGDPVLSNNYSYSLSERGLKLDYALELINKALESEPENGSFLDTKGWVLFQLGEYTRAVEFIRKSIAIRDTSAEVWEHLGDVYEKLGKFDEAVNAWRKALEIDHSRRTLIEKLERREN